MSALAEQWAALPPYLIAHLRLTLTALAIGLAVSIPLGVAATRRPAVENIALGVASVLQTIPGLALLALMVPLLAWLGPGFEALGFPAPPTIGFLPAVIALSLYSVLPMLRNTVTGIAEVDPSLLESARGVGMSPREVLLQVELPLAMPTIVAGIRTATVWVVGTATLATPVGAPSLGNPIFAGLQTRNLAAVVVGSLAAVALALVLDTLIRSVETGLARRRRGALWMATGALLVIVAFAFIDPSAGQGRSQNGAGRFEVVIGSKSFTEQYVLTEVLEGILLEAPDVRVRRLPSLGSSVAFDALVSGSLDAYVDYTGTIWATILKQDMRGVSRESVLEAVRLRLPEEYGIHVLADLGFENTYALAMRADQAEALGIERISDLRGHSEGLEIASDYEFFDREEWLAVESEYRLRFAAERGMDAALMYEAIRTGNVDVISAYSTDGRIAAYDLRLLEDDLGAMPPYDTIIVGSGRLVEEAPALADRLRALEGSIDAEEMGRMNAAVDLEGESPAAVARAWLEGWAAENDAARSE